jgi:hypothetical protein
LTVKQHWVCRWVLGWWVLVGSVLAHPPDTTEPAPALRHRVLRIAPLPALSYAPETRLSVGATILGTLRLSPTARPTDTRLEFAVTQNRQAIVELEGSAFTPHERWFFRLGAQWRYFPELYWGVGNRQPATAAELYTSHRLEAHAVALRLCIPRWKLYAGPSWRLQYLYNVRPSQPNGLLETEPHLVGRTGGVSSGLGAQVLLDRRDAVLTPTRGYLLAAENLYFQPWLGSDFRFTRLNTEARGYIRLRHRLHTGPDYHWVPRPERRARQMRWPVQRQPRQWYRSHVLALQARALLHTGQPPFRMLALMGSSRELRGYYNGRFRDRNLLSGQVEYRFPVVWRFGGVVFAGLGDVFDTPPDLALRHLKPSLGGGVRFLFDRASNAYLRCDFGIGASGQTGLYFGYGEVF